jgi:hypothetical protein
LLNRSDLYQKTHGMGKEIKFSADKTPDNKTRFILDGITITTDECSDRNGKHEITTPRTAIAYCMCCGKKYVVTNVEAIRTVEDWYTEELLPKFQMLRLLIGDIQVQGDAGVSK